MIVLPHIFTEVNDDQSLMSRFLSIARKRTIRIRFRQFRIFRLTIDRILSEDTFLSLLIIARSVPFAF